MPRLRRRLFQAAPILVLLSLLSWQVWVANQEERVGYWSTDGGGGRMAAGALVMNGPADPPVVHELMAPSTRPFNPRTEVRFQLASNTRVRVEVHDVRGRLVRTLVDDQRSAGEHEVVWNGTDDRGQTVDSGTYYLRLTADGQVRTQKMALLE